MSTLAWNDVLEYLKGTGLAHLSTVTADHSPHVAIVFPAIDADKIWLTMRTSSAKYRNLASHPAVALVWQGNGAETYVWGRVSLHHDSTTKLHVWNGGFIPFDLGHFYGTAESESWAVGLLEPSRATVMVQTEQGLNRKTWRAQA